MPTHANARMDPGAALIAALADDHASFMDRLPDGEHVAFADLRRAAMAQLVARGLPSTSDEDWRFTDLRPVTERTYVRPSPGKAPASVAELAPAIEGAHTVVLIDGSYSPELSTLDNLPGPVLACGLADAMRSHADLVAQHLGRHAKPELSPFVALASAFAGDGVFLHVPAGTALEAPVHVIALTSGALSGDGTAPLPVSYPRALVVLEDGARATLVETYAALTPGGYLTCPVTEIALGTGSRLEHYRLQQDDPSAFVAAALLYRHQADSLVRSRCFTTGSAVCRIEVGSRLDGEGADCALDGLYLLDGRHVDIHMLVEHTTARGTSRQLYKGILEGQANAVFTGRIKVSPDAQQTDASQANRNLLLSGSARINSNPQLEILADDVRCTHGATVGQLDEDALFYLRSRGIGLDAARAMLVRAFAEDLLSDIGLPGLRARLEVLLGAALDARTDSSVKASGTTT